MKRKNQIFTIQSFAIGLLIFFGGIFLYLLYQLYLDLRALQPPTSFSIHMGSRDIIDETIKERSTLISDAIIPENLPLIVNEFEIVNQQCNTIEWCAESEQISAPIIKTQNILEEPNILTTEVLSKHQLEVNSTTPTQMESQTIITSEGLADFQVNSVAEEMESNNSNSGLLERHNEIAESIFLLEQQLKQAKLIQEYLELMGPDIPVEIAPGRFETFQSTPAGKRIIMEQKADELQAKLEILEIQKKLAQTQREFTQNHPKIWENGDTGIVLDDETQSSIQLLEIMARKGVYEAILLVDDLRTPVKVGTSLPDGQEVVAIQPNEVSISQMGGLEVLRIQ